MQETTIGRHRYRRRGDVLGLDFVGHISESDLRELREVMNSVLTESDHFFMISDMSKCTGIDAAGRKYMGEWSKEQNGSNIISVVHGVSFATRVIVMLAINAIKLLGKREVEMSFVKTEAEALAWVDEQRALRYPEYRP